MTNKFAKVVGITSSKGGVGKTVITANLGCALSKITDKQILLIDGDLTNASLTMHFGLTKPPVSIQEILKEKEDPNEGIMPLGERLYILASDPFHFPETDLAAIDFNFVARELHQLKKDYDLILLDTIPQMSPLARSLIVACDSVLIVTDPFLPSVTASMWSDLLASRYEIPVLGLVLNRVKERRYELSSNQVQEEADIQVIGMIPEDEFIPRAIQEGEPAVRQYRDSPAVEEIVRFAKRLNSEFEPMEEERLDMSEVKKEGRSYERKDAYRQLEETLASSGGEDGTE